MTPEFLALTKVWSVLVNIRDIPWDLSKRGSELGKSLTFTIWTKKVCAKIKLVLMNNFLLKFDLPDIVVNFTNAKTWPVAKGLR